LADKKDIQVYLDPKIYSISFDITIPCICIISDLSPVARPAHSHVFIPFPANVKIEHL